MVRDHAAPNCKFPGCTNHTWNPDQLCHHHVGKAIPGEGNDFANNPAYGAPNQANGFWTNATAESIYASAQATFPDLEEMDKTPSSIRQQAYLSVRAAVSLDVFRSFPQYDVADASVRDQGLKNYYVDLMSRVQMQPVSFDEGASVLLFNSSEDSYGRATEDSVGLSSYALRKEWEYANALGITEDQDGISYSQPYEGFMTSVQGHVDAAATDEFSRQVNRWPTIINNVSGRAPLNQEQPILTGQSMVPAQHDFQSGIHVGRGVHAYGRVYPDQVAATASADKVQSVKRVAGAVGGLMWDMAKTTRSNTKARNTAFQDNLDAQKARKRQREEDELRRQLLKNLRRN